MTDPREGSEPEGPVIRDKRRLDPVTGQVREPAAPAGSAPAGPSGDPAAEAAGASEGPADDETATALAERTADLQRLQAEYANYRRRVDRDREVVRETAVANVLSNLLPVLDDIGRARDHGELEGGFKSVGEALEQMVERLGLERYGAAGDPFDPVVHEALTHAHSPDVTVPTCVEVFQPGYRLGDRIVRPARVAVADPEQ
ncbi:MAG TPA: nucleotide exchange factor GrpE [Actinomycetes bacterium]|nr:nucleotide exchange factor GrpE [Actinomycetes bacterium]